jgi:hypothetical protein
LVLIGGESASRHTLPLFLSKKLLKK